MGKILNFKNSAKGTMREARGIWIRIKGRADKRRETSTERREALFLNAACGIQI
ncbi:hypothetical protein ACFWDI_40850 [Streptomyces sp. NPDC060064]|uniref:hypothetical protein n=1 Tax=Streptomyces sp. NPDC060064 TaxID=3347049 RepID=UPI0036A3D4F0